MEEGIEEDSKDNVAKGGKRRDSLLVDQVWEEWNMVVCFCIDPPPELLADGDGFGVIVGGSNK